MTRENKLATIVDEKNGIDPLSVPDELLELAADREPLVVLTAPWHERDTQSMVERLGVPVFVPPPDPAASER